MCDHSSQQMTQIAFVDEPPKNLTVFEHCRVSITMDNKKHNKHVSIPIYKKYIWK